MFLGNDSNEGTGEHPPHNNGSYYLSIRREHILILFTFSSCGVVAREFV